MSMRNERFTLSERRASNGSDPLDALIDSAARQIVAGEPSTALRSAVRKRIEHRRSPWSLSPVFAVATAAVIAAVFVGRALLGPPGAPDEARPAIERAAIPVEQLPAVVAPDTGSVRLQAAQTPVRLGRRLADDVAAPPQEEEPPIAPIAVEPLEPVQIAVGNPITVESSGVMPIEIAPLQLEPLRGIE